MDKTKGFGPEAASFAVPELGFGNLGFSDTTVTSCLDHHEDSGG